MTINTNAGPESVRPNIVLFISDQQRADTLPGSSLLKVRAPHIAWLSQRGAQFDRAFCTVPLCTPARASILSGLYPHQSGIVSNYLVSQRQQEFPRDVKLIADYLRPAGYRCAYTGKWHLPTGSDRRGFKDFITRLGVHDVDGEEDDDAIRFAGRVGLEVSGDYASYLTSHKRRIGNPDDPVCGRTTKLPLAFHHSTLQAQQAAHFIRSMQDKDEPFLLVHSCIEPHPMSTNYNIVPCPFDKMYDPREMYLPATCREARAPFVLRKRNFGNNLTPTDYYTDDQIRAIIAGYYAAVSYVDYLLGIILEALLSTDQFDETLVIFVSDHGEMLGDHRMLRKGPVMFEEMIRIPLVIKPPQPAGNDSERTAKAFTTRQLVSQVDLVPTILDYCGQDLPTDLPGCNLSPLLAGKDQPAREGLAVEYYGRFPEGVQNPLRAWRTQSWKYVETIGGDDELYNLEKDPGEEHNLVDSPEASPARDKMKKDLYSWVRASGDPWPNVDIPADLPLGKPGPWAELAKKMC